MLGHFGFSFTGLLYLIMLMIPNLIWTKNKPEGYGEVVIKENRVLYFFERIGEMAVTVSALFFLDYDLGKISVWSFWLLVSFVLMLIYEMAWIHYFKGEHTLGCYYGKYLGIPIPLALLPVTAFFLLGIYGKVIWMMISVFVLGIGHIGIHLQHWRECQ